MKALVVSLSIPFIGRLHFSEIRNIPSIGYEETKARKGSSLAWNIPFIGTARFGASTSRRCIGVPDKERSAARVRMVAYKLRQVVSRPRKISNLSMAGKQSPHR